MHTRTPTARNTNASRIMTIAAAPAVAVYRISTAAPTSTNKTTSAAIQSFPNFSESLPETDLGHLIFRTHAMLTTASRPDTDT